MKKLFSIIMVFAIGIIATPLFGSFAIPVAFGASLVSGGDTGITFAGLNKEVWLDVLMEGFYADDSFLSECRDLSPFVENDILNLAEAGGDPAVLINNASYPIPINDRTDAPLALTIDTFDSENTKIVKAESVELNYDKMASVVAGHKNAIRMKIMEKGIHTIAPATNGTFTPLLTASGADNGLGFKALKFADVLNLQKAFEDAEMPPEGRILILSTQHKTDLQIENITLYNQMAVSGTLYGFKLYSLAAKRLPRYNKTTGAKVAFGAAAAPSTDTIASVAFQKDEVGRAMGTNDMFHSKAENDPIYRRDVLGFQQRAMVIPIRNKGIAAIYSPAA